MPDYPPLPSGLTSGTSGSSVTGFSPVTSALISAGGQLVGNIANNAYTDARNRLQEVYDDHTYNRQRTDALADWNMTNQYNSPLATMARFKAAGLNPNLIYGQTNNATAVRSSDVKSFDPETKSLNVGGAVSGGILAYQDARIKNATVDNMAAQNDVLLEDAKLKKTQQLATMASIPLTNANADNVTIEAGIKRSLLPYQLTAADLKNRQTSTDIIKTEADTAFTNAQNKRAGALNSATLTEIATRVGQMKINNAKTQEEIERIHQETQNLIRSGELQDLDLRLKRNGIQPTDNMLFRVIGQLTSGGKLDDIIKAIKTKGINDF